MQSRATATSPRGVKAASEIVGETNRIDGNAKSGTRDLQCVANHDDDDEPPMRLGGDRNRDRWGATRVSAG